MNNHQHLVEVVVGRILDKYNVNVTSDLSINDQVKVKDTVLDIQAEVNKFLENQDMDTVGNRLGVSSESNILEKSLLKKQLEGHIKSQDKEDSYEVNNVISPESNDYFEKPAIITRKRTPNSFDNRRRY